MELTIGAVRISVTRISPDLSELSARYDRRARSWNAGLEVIGYARAYRRLFSHLISEGLLRHLRHGSRVLDCGIGAAALSLALTTTVTLALHITGVDIAPVMLKTASSSLSRAGIQHELHRRNAQYLSFADNPFDLVMSAHMLEHLADPQQALSEMFRVLRPGAPLIVLVTRPGVPDAVMRLRWGHSPIPVSQLAHWMESIGLSRVRVLELGSPFSLARRFGIACIGVRPTESDLPNHHQELAMRQQDPLVPPRV